MNRLTIQARLTAWYFLSAAIIISLFAGGSWLAMKASMYNSIDRDLRYRAASVVPFIESHSLNMREDFTRTFTTSSDSSIVGVFVQITDDRSQVLYESEILTAHSMPVLPAAPANGSVSLTTAGSRGWPVRVVSQRFVVDGVPLTIHVIEPLRDLMSALREYNLYLAVLVPLALILTTTVGYTMSRRALAPVEHIRQQAQAIDPADLTTRLQVPPTNDELARLARTLNAMLARIEASFRSVQQFTADASHELRAPLAFITTAAEVSLRRERSREELTEVLNKVVREARHMSRLIDNLLDLARGDAGRHQEEYKPVGLTSILRDLCTELTPAAGAKGLTLTAELPAGETMVRGDSTELRRLFLILLDNAMKYTEAGLIGLTLTSHNGVTVKVADTGIGIEPSAIHRIFDRFWRADKVRSRAEGGAGLGLSLASQIVQRHGGAITVKSTPGKGSTFTVQLPSAPNPQNS